MADVSKLKLGSTTYDIKAKSGTATTALYGICTTAAATAAKEVIIVDPTVTRTDLLAVGTILHVKFSNANGVANPTLTCFNNSGTVASPTKGSTTLMAAKSIKRYGTTAPSTSAASSWRAGAIVALVYDGTNWIEVTAIDDNTTYSNMSLGSAFCTSTTTADTVAKVATPVNGTCSLVTNGIVSVRFTYGNTAASPTLNVSSKGAKPIWYRGAVISANQDIWNAGDTVTFYYDNTRYNIIAVEKATLNALSGFSFCYSSTAANTAAKTVVATTPYYKPVTDSIVSVQFTYGNTAENPTLNIESQGAKPIYYRGAALTADNAAIWSAGDTVTFYYDNTRYNIIAIDNNHPIVTQTTQPVLAIDSTINTQIWIEI